MSRLQSEQYPALATAPRPNGRVLTAPSVRMPLPGPGSAALLRRQERRESNVRTYPRGITIAIKRGSGSYLEDLDGNILIDFLTGAGALPLGHSHPELLEAIDRQLPLLTHALDLPTEVRDEFISTQLEMLPEAIRDDMRIEFCGPSGADAVDAALKLCKTATGRSEIVSFQGAFHGSSHAAMTVSGLVAHKQRIASGVPGVHFFPYPYPLRCALGAGAQSGARCLAYLEHALRDPLGGIAPPAALIMEIVQGEGGVIPAPVDFVQGVRRLTTELGIPLIVDEVQSGGGRTGTWFAFEQHGIEPDVIVASKAIGGAGMPLAIILHRRELDVFDPGAHTGTFRGNQLAFAAGTAAARIIKRDGILEHVAVMGAHLHGELDRMTAELPFIAEVRARGLMIGIELVDPDTGEPASALARRLQREAIQRGLILELGGRGDAVARLLPPLNVAPRTVEQALEILADTFAAIAPGSGQSRDGGRSRLAPAVGC
jgi:diaminobutyrate-2-oxoglutarate transaminase